MSRKKRILDPTWVRITLRRNISTVTRELDLEDLWMVLEALMQHGRPDFVSA